LRRDLRHHRLQSLGRLGERLLGPVLAGLRALTQLLHLALLPQLASRL